jgi:hypothetical protein
VHWDDPVSSSAPPELFGGLGDCSLAQVSHAQVVVRIAIVRIDLLSSCQLAHSFVDALLVQAGGAQVRVRIGIARVGLDRLLGMTALIDGRSRMRFALPTPMGESITHRRDGSFAPVMRWSASKLGASFQGGSSR